MVEVRTFTVLGITVPQLVLNFKLKVFISESGRLPKVWVDRKSRYDADLPPFPLLAGLKCGAHPSQTHGYQSGNLLDIRQTNVYKLYRMYKKLRGRQNINDQKPEGYNFRDRCGREIYFYFLFFYLKILGLFRSWNL